MYKLSFSLIMITLLVFACKTKPTPLPVEVTMASTQESTLLLPFDFARSYSELYLIDQVGYEYFQDHYRLLNEDRMGEYLLKAVLVYSYEPYVRDFEFIFWLDFKSWQPCPDTTSCILMEPQEFLITPEAAVVLAQQNGLPVGQNYDTHLVLEAYTQNRFAWKVIPLSDQLGSPEFETLSLFVFDVETGQVYTPSEDLSAP